RGQGDRGREEQDAAILPALVVREERAHELTRVARAVVHLPVGREERPLEHHFPLRASSASTPGSGLPSRNSSEAPPPVETWLIALARPASSTAAAESPPPTIVVAPFFVASALAS